MNGKSIKNQKGTGIKKRLIRTSVTILFLAIFVTGFVACYLSYTSTLSTLEHTLKETEKVAAARVAAELETYKELAQELAVNEIFMQEIPDTGTLVNGKSREDVIKEIVNKSEQTMKRKNFTIVARTDKDGISVESGLDLSDRDYFLGTKNTNSACISEPIVRKDTGEVNIMIAAPVLRDGNFDGMLYFGVDAGFLCDIVGGINIGKTGNASMINKEGTTIGYADKQLVIDGYNTQEEAKKDPQLKKLAQLEKKMMNGESGFGDYIYGGVSKFVSYGGIEGTNGWSIYLAIEKNEFLVGTYVSIIITIIIAIVSLLIAISVMTGIAKKISNPIGECVDRIMKLAQGDLKSDIPLIKTNDELEVLSDCTRQVVEEFYNIITDITVVIGNISNGNLNTKSEVQYVGDFVPIGESIVKILDSLNNDMMQIGNSSNHVADSAREMCDSAQVLSESAMDQAGSVEELVATFEEITNKINITAKNSVVANERTNEVGSELNIGCEKMNSMTGAMEDIKNKSAQIGEIIKTIDDIASQTNLLSLNAAIEAARAGEAGKGFAVVADEIRVLADQSAQAARDIVQLVSDSMNSVDKGVDIAAETSKALNGVIKSSISVSGIVSDIAVASKEQAESMSQVKIGIDQLSLAIQTNSATSQETAAASEELTGQSQILKSLVEKFEFRK